MATFKPYQDKNGNMQWGVLLADNETGSTGKKIDVIKRNGKTKTVTLDNPVFGIERIWSIVGGSKPKYGRYIPRYGKCKDCGAAIPSKYEQCLTCKDKAPAPKRAPLQCATEGCNNAAIGGSTNLCMSCYRGNKPKQHEVEPAKATRNSDCKPDPFPGW